MAAPSHPGPHQLVSADTAAPPGRSLLGLPDEPPHMSGYHAPGRPLPMAQRREVHRSAVTAAQLFLRAEGFLLLEKGGFNGPRAAGSEMIAAEKRDLNVIGLCTLQERLLKRIAASLTADQVGGANVTRLARMIVTEHPRLTARQASEVLQRRGFRIAARGQLSHEAEAALIYHCGNLPLHIMRSPDQVDYLLPHAGVTISGVFPGTPREGPCRGGFRLNMARLLQYLMGVDALRDAVISESEG